MKSLIKISLVLFAMVAFGATSFGQTQTASATANTTATIVTPIAIVQTTDLEFGNVAVSATNAGTVAMSTNSTRTVTGGCTLPATTGTTTAAAFTVTGASGFTYAITLPASVSIDDNNSNTMLVNGFVSDPDGTGTLSGGTETLKVGATLNVAAGQAAGTYESDNDFEVTVAYN